MMTSAYLEYWAGNFNAAYMQYLVLAELGYEVAQSNVALMLEDGELIHWSPFDILPNQLCYAFRVD